MLVALVDALLRHTELLQKTVKYTGQGLNLEKNFRVFDIGFDPSSKRCSSLRSISDDCVFERGWCCCDQLVDLGSELWGDRASIEVDDLGDDTCIAQETLHLVPGGVLTAHEEHHSAKNMHDRFWWHSEVLDFIKIRRLELTYCSPCSVDFWLNA